MIVQVSPGFLVEPEHVSAPGVATLLNAVWVTGIFVTVAVPKVTDALPPTVSVTSLGVFPFRLPKSSDVPSRFNVPTVAPVNETAATRTMLSVSAAVLLAGVGSLPPAIVTLLVEFPSGATSGTLPTSV